MGNCMCTILMPALQGNIISYTSYLLRIHTFSSCPQPSGLTILPIISAYRAISGLGSVDHNTGLTRPGRFIKRHNVSITSTWDQPYV